MAMARRTALALMAAADHEAFISLPQLSVMLGAMGEPAIPQPIGVSCALRGMGAVEPLYG
jgi:hypothetical protein